LGDHIDRCNTVSVDILSFAYQDGEFIVKITNDHYINMAKHRVHNVTDYTGIIMYGWGNVACNMHVPSRLSGVCENKVYNQGW